MPHSTEPTARAFFALVPPPWLQRAIADVARETARRAHGRPVPAENVHITLAFIGAWPIARMSVLLEAAAQVDGEPMAIALDRMGAFRRAGIAWIAPSAPPAGLMRLAASLAEALSAAGITLDPQPYRPHVTLARHCRGPYAHDIVAPFSWDADCFTLMASQTRAEGARYSRLAEWRLQSDARRGIA
jgi:2'-5' RNA ligase